jgi:nucleoid-associated protein YgaU
LAERYLGDADRYLEIYEANRDLLPSPEVLPIGARLKIPRRREGRAPADRGLQRPLVPVVPPS